MNHNVWNDKPWWCQPWTILLVGTAIVAGGWGLTRNLWVVLGLSTVIGLWWGYFLLLYPYLFNLYAVQMKNADSASRGDEVKNLES